MDRPTWYDNKFIYIPFISLSHTHITKERYDYNDLENVVFIQDFPLASKATTSITHLPRFAQDIANILEQMHVPSSVQDELLKYDFSRAKAHVVASVSGNFQGHDQYRQYGHARLAQIIREIGAADPNRPPRIEMQVCLGLSSRGCMCVNFFSWHFNNDSIRHPPSAA